MFDCWGGRLDSFDGVMGWKDWSIVFRSHAAAGLPMFGLLMDGMEKNTTPVMNVTLTPDERACSTQLYCMIMVFCKCAALACIVTAGAQEGLETWKSLFGANKPSPLTRRAGLLQDLRVFSLEGDILGRSAQYDHDIDNVSSSALACIYSRFAGG